MRIAICCADVGSIARGKFGWAALDSEVGEVRTGTSIEDFASVVAALLNTGVPVALGFECPLFVPLPRDPMRLTSARRGEGSRPWCAGAGAGALATGLTEVTWMLARVRERVSVAPPVHFEWRDFSASPSGLLIWEAFVSGALKTTSHTGDAERGVEAMRSRLPDPTDANRISEPEVFSLAAAALLRAGWRIPNAFLAQPCLVLAPDHDAPSGSATP